MNRVYPRHREENLFFYECAASLHVAYFILLHLLCTTSVLHMVAISLDRFVTVVFPLRHRNFIEVCGLKVYYAHSIMVYSDSCSRFKVYRSARSFSRLIH